MIRDEPFGVRANQKKLFIETAPKIAGIGKTFDAEK